MHSPDPLAAADLDGEADAREFAAGGDLCETLQRLTGIRAHYEFDVVDSVRGEFVRIRLHAHGELAAPHAENLHEPGDVSAQRVGRQLPGRRQALCRGAIVRVEELELLFERSEVDLRIVEHAHFLLDTVALRRQFEHGLPVFARQGFERGGVPLDFLLPARIDLERVEVTAQRFGGLMGQDHGLREKLRGVGKLRVGIAQRAQGGRRLGQLIVSAVGVGIVDRQ